MHMRVQLALVSSGPVCAAHPGAAAFHACRRLAATACTSLGGATESACSIEGGVCCTAAAVRPVSPAACLRLLDVLLYGVLEVRLF